jgi:hypothetical protein
MGMRRSEENFENYHYQVPHTTLPSQHTKRSVEIFENCPYPTSYYGGKSEREAIKLLKEKYLNIKISIKNIRRYEDWNEQIENAPCEPMADFQKTMFELKIMIEEEKEIDPQRFKLEIANSEEADLSMELHRLLAEKIKTLPEGVKRSLYEKAQEYLFEARVKYSKRRLETYLQKYLQMNPELAKKYPELANWRLKIGP